jgi:hypothetical protein
MGIIVMLLAITGLVIINIAKINSNFKDENKK